MVTAFPITRRYVKKEHAKDLLNKIRYTSGIGLIILSLISFIIYLLIRNGLAINPISIEQHYPFISPLMIFLILLIPISRGFYILFNKSNSAYADIVLRNYKNNDLIESSKLVSIKDQLLMILFVSIPIICFVLSAVIYTRN